MSISWNVLKITLLNTLMNWLVGELWSIAKDIVLLFTHRDDLTGQEKLATALAMLTDKAKELGIELSTSTGNFLMEAAVQAMKSRMAK